VSTFVIANALVWLMSIRRVWKRTQL